jgi:hypothetical protein
VSVCPEPVLAKAICIQFLPSETCHSMQRVTGHVIVACCLLLQGRVSIRSSIASMQPGTAQVTGRQADRQTGRQADRQTDSGRKTPTALDNDSLCTCPCVTNSRLPRRARDKSNATKIDQKSRTLFVSGAVCNRDLAQHFVLRGVQPGAALSLRDQDRCDK